jgi:hypothetical protein
MISFQYVFQPLKQFHVYSVKIHYNILIIFYLLTLVSCHAMKTKLHNCLCDTRWFVLICQLVLVILDFITCLRMKRYPLLGISFVSFSSTVTIYRQLVYGLSLSLCRDI